MAKIEQQRRLALATERFERNGLAIKGLIVNAVEKPTSDHCFYGYRERKAARQGFDAP